MRRQMVTTMYNHEEKRLFWEPPKIVKAVIYAYADVICLLKFLLVCFTDL